MKALIYIVEMVIAIVLHLALIAAVAWVIVKVLQATGVL